MPTLQGPLYPEKFYTLTIPNKVIGKTFYFKDRTGKIIAASPKEAGTMMKLVDNKTGMKANQLVGVSDSSHFLEYIRKAVEKQNTALDALRAKYKTKTSRGYIDARLAIAQEAYNALEQAVTYDFEMSKDNKLENPPINSGQMFADNTFSQSSVDGLSRGLNARYGQ